MHCLAQWEIVEIMTLTKVWAAVVVKSDKAKKTLTLSPPKPDEPTSVIIGAKTGTHWTRLPSAWRIVSADGVKITRERGRSFWVSLDTCEPTHLVIDVPDEGGPLRR